MRNEMKRMKQRYEDEKAKADKLAKVKRTVADRPRSVVMASRKAYNRQRVTLSCKREAEQYM